jgi:hypothetical protein
MIDLVHRRIKLRHLNDATIRSLPLVTFQRRQFHLCPARVGSMHCLAVVAERLLGEPFRVSAVELMQTLERDMAVFLNRKPLGDFPPRFALLALCADDRHEWLNATVIGASAAPSARPRVRFRLRFHATILDQQ